MISHIPFPSMTTFTPDQLDALAIAIQPSLNTHLESLLNERFSDLKSSLEGKWADVQSEWWDKLSVQVTSHVADIRAMIPSEIRKISPTVYSAPEPSVLSDSSYSGGHSSLRGFLHVVRDTLSSRSHAFPDDSARINC